MPHSSFTNTENEEHPTRLIWLVIPSFNDAARLACFLPELCSMLKSLPLSVTVQVVDDGSRQADKEALEELLRESRSHFSFVRPAIFLGCNQGKGAAVLAGWEAADGASWLGFLDADGAVPAKEVCRMILEKIVPFTNPETSLFASRIQMRGRSVKRSLKRHLMGRVFATLVGNLIDSGIYDSQCGFKLIPFSAYRKIKPLLQEKRFAFDVELLAALNLVGCPVEEYPVDWHDVPGSKVYLIRDSLRMFCAVRLIRTRMKKAREMQLAKQQ